MKYGPPPTLDDLVEMAEAALAAIPEVLREGVRGAAIVVEEVADDETLAEMGIENAWDLTGLYRGTALTRKSLGDVPAEPDMILLYREPILLEWIETGEDLFRIVRNVLLHEIGHHFGLSEEDIDRLEGNE